MPVYAECFPVEWSLYEKPWYDSLATPTSAAVTFLCDYIKEQIYQHWPQELKNASAEEITRIFLDAGESLIEFPGPIPNVYHS